MDWRKNLIVAGAAVWVLALALGILAIWSDDPDFGNKTFATAFVFGCVGTALLFAATIPEYK